MKITKGFSKFIFLPIFIIAMAAIFALSSCCVSIPLKFASRAASAASSTDDIKTVENAQNTDSVIDETADAPGDESIADSAAAAAETTSSTKESAADMTSDTDSEATTETNGPSAPYSNDFTLYDLDKNLVSMHDYAGKIVVLNFWATWCPPCVAEIPDFVDAWNTYKSKNIQFFGISDDDVNAIADFVKENKMTYPTLIDGSSDQIMQSWGIDAIPHTFILDGSGEIIFDQLGMMSGDQLVNAIESALKQQ